MFYKSSSLILNGEEFRLFFSLKTLFVPCIFQAISKKGASFLEAPVSGSKKPAENGQLVILAAGDQVHEFVRNVLIFQPSPDRLAA